MKFLKNLIIIGTLLLLPIIFFEEVFFNNKFVHSGCINECDSRDLYYPIKEFISRSLKNFDIPLWCPYISNGFPLLAQGEGGIFYPPNFILSFLFPTLSAFNYSIVFNFFLVGLFTYIYCKTLKISSLASLSSAVAFMFSSFFLLRTNIINIINVSAWVPIQLVIIEKLFEEKKIKWGIFLGITFALQILAGHPNMTFYSAFGIFIYTCYKFITQQDLKKNLLSLIPLFILAGIIGILLSSIQLLPTYELIKFSPRKQGLTYEQATVFPYHPRNILTLINPYVFGNPADGTYTQDIENYGLFFEVCNYVGILPLIFAIISILFLFREKKIIKFFSISIPLFFLIALGKFTPLYYFLWKFIPLFNYFRLPTRFLIFPELFIAVLAGFGIDFVFKRFSSISKIIIKLLLLIVIVFDLFIFGMKYIGYIDADKWLSPPKTVQFLNKEKEMFRIYSMGVEFTELAFYNIGRGWKEEEIILKHQEKLQPDFNMIFGISAINTRVGKYLGLQLERNSNIEFLISQKLSFYKDWSCIIGTPKISKILGLMNVKYILSAFNINDTNFKPVINLSPYEKSSIKVYENINFLPRVLLVSKSVYKNGEKEILSYILGNDFNPKEEVVLEEQLDWSSTYDETSSYKIVKYEPKLIEIDVTMVNKGFLVLLDSYYTGWKVYVDGKEESCLKANYLFRGVKLDKGNHKVKFIYNPISFKIGAGISLLSIIIIPLLAHRHLF